jgi:hypothetical protein
MRIKSTYFGGKNPIYDVKFSDSNWAFEDSYIKQELIDLGIELLDIANHEGKFDEEFTEIFINKIKKEFSFIYDKISEEVLDKYHEEHFEDLDRE